MSIELELPSTPAEKAKAAKETVSQIDKELGAGSIFSMKDRVGLVVPSIPSGLYSLDNYVLGIGGLARGRIHEAFGSEASGKTSLALLLISQAQRNSELCAFVDAEHALDSNWANLIGVNMDDLYISQPDCGEDALKVVDMLVRSGAFGLIVIDSVAALVPRAELEGEIGDAHMALQARLMSQGLRMLSGVTSKTKTTLLFLNQTRTNIGVSYGDPNVTAGGKALKFYSSVRLQVSRIGSVKAGEDIVGNKVKIKASKNKLSAPFRDTEIDLLFNEGFSVSSDLLESAVSAKVIVQAGSWFSYQGERIGQGRLNAKKYLDDPTTFTKIYQEVKNASSTK